MPFFPLLKVPEFPTLSGIAWEPCLCSRVRFSRSRCERCLSGCPEGALSWGKALDLDRDKCTGCGLCLALCPNGALWEKEKGDPILVREINFLLSQGRGDTFRFACSRCGEVRAPVQELPCLGRLTEALLLAPFLAGATRVELWNPGCLGCDYERGLSHLQGTIRFAEGLARMLGREGPIEEHEGVQRASPSPPRSPASRREFLQRAGSVGLWAAAALFPWPSGEEKADPWAHPASPRRTYLLRLIRSFRVRFPVSVEARGLPLADIEIGDNCTGCPVCSTLCPPGALKRVEREGRVFFYFQPWLCSGCHVCSEACLFRAISTTPTVSLNSLIERKPRLLAVLSPRTCPACRQPFLGKEGGRCPSCQTNKKDHEHPAIPLQQGI